MFAQYLSGFCKILCAGKDCDDRSDCLKNLHVLSGIIIQKSHYIYIVIFKITHKVCKIEICYFNLFRSIRCL